MIFEALWNMFTSVTELMFTPLPNLPPAPAALTTGADALLDYAASGIYLMRYIFSTSLLNIALGIFLAVFIFERGYTTIMFVLRKLPFINIK